MFEHDFFISSHFPEPQIIWCVCVCVEGGGGGGGWDLTPFFGLSKDTHENEN